MYKFINSDDVLNQKVIIIISIQMFVVFLLKLWNFMANVNTRCYKTNSTLISDTNKVSHADILEVLWSHLSDDILEVLGRNILAVFHIFFLLFLIFLHCKKTTKHFFILFKSIFLLSTFHISSTPQITSSVPQRVYTEDS